MWVKHTHRWQKSPTGVYTTTRNRQPCVQLVNKENLIQQVLETRVMGGGECGLRHWGRHDLLEIEEVGMKAKRPPSGFKDGRMDWILIWTRAVNNRRRSRR